MNFRSAVSVDDLRRLYLEEGLTIDQIAARFGLSQTSVRRRMRDLGIRARPRGPYVDREREYEWSPELAYAVGLIATDGNLSPDGRHMTITSADEDLLETARTCLRVTVSIGLMTAKSLRLGPLAVCDEYFADFLRGCIDGGCIIRPVSRAWPVSEMWRCRF